jgi:peptide/nickel transport system substrate-binding protein
MLTTHFLFRRRPSRRWARPALAAALGLLLIGTAACGGADEGAAPQERPGGTLVVAQSSDILTMDPAMHRSRVTQAVIRNVFDGLVNQDAKLTIVPELAEKWEPVDASTWRFHLRQGVKFHNGEPFDATAVKFSIDRVLDPKQASPRASMLEMVESVEVEDPNTVVIRTKGPAPTLLPSLAVNEIVPPKYLQQVGDEGFAAKPVGTGAFTFEEWVPNERVTLKANADYWGGAANVEKLVFRPIPEVAARLASLNAGEVQVAGEIPPDLAGTLSGDVKAATVDGTRVFFLAMNVTKPPFKQPEVRVAVNRAINRDSLVKDLLRGHGRPLNQPLFPEVIGYAEDYQGYSFDLDQAKQALTGVAQPVTIDVEEKDRTLAEAVAGQLQAAGLKARINILETQAFTRSIETGASQAYLSSWGVAEGDADVIFARHFWSPTRKSAVYTGYTNPDLDELIVAARSTVDREARERTYAEAVEMVMRDAPWAPLLNAQEIYGVSTRISGFEPSPIGRYNVTETGFVG